MKRIIGVFLLFCILCSVGMAATKSGTWGNNLTWSLDDNGTFTISGTGELISYDYDDTLSDDIEQIKKVIIQDGVTSIGDYAFSDNWDNVTSIEIPKSVTVIGYSAFVGCSGLKSINVSADNSVYSSVNGALYDKNIDTLIKVPAALTSYTISSTVTSIGSSAFYGCSGLKSIDIPSGVTSIGESAFSGCSGLTSIDIPSGVMSIGYNAFSYCRGLTSIDIPSSVTSIGDYTFSYCSGLTSIVIPSSVTSIGGYAFYYCSNLASIELPSGVTSIGESAFNSSGLTSINIPRTVIKIGELAFSNCSSLSDVNIQPGGVTKLGGSAFWNCDSLINFTVPNGVTRLGEHLFSFSDNLTTVSIPSSVESIASDSFTFCKNLRSIDVSSNNPYLASVDGVLYDKELEKLLIAPDAITDIKVPNSVTSIDWAGVSWYNSLTTITIPMSVTSLGSNAFNSCENLKDVYYAGTESQWNAISIMYGGSIEERFGEATIHFNYSSEPDFTLPSSLSAIGANAFIGTQGYSIRVPGNLTQIDSNAIPSGVTIYAPKGSQSAAWFKGNGYKVVEE